MKNFTIDYADRRASIEARIASVTKDYEDLAEALEKYGFGEKEPSEIINTMFDSTPLETLKRKEFEAFVKVTPMPAELRDNSLRLMLISIPQEAKDLISSIKAEFLRDTANWNITPSDIRYHYRKFKLTEEKESELLASTHYTLTDEEQRDCEAMADIITKLRDLRHHNNIRHLINSFVSDRMTPDNDRPIEELARAVHENRCLSKAEIEAAQQARLEKERREAEEWEREREEERRKEIEEEKRKRKIGAAEPSQLPSFIQRQWEKVEEFRRNTARRQHQYGTTPANANGQTTDEEADRIRASIPEGHGEMIFVK